MDEEKVPADNEYPDFLFEPKVWVRLACVIALLNSFVLLGTMWTEVSYSVGAWFTNFLQYSVLLYFIVIPSLWSMRKWAVIAYTVITITTQIVLYKFDEMWSFFSLIIPVTVIVISWKYFSKMK